MLSQNTPIDFIAYGKDGTVVLLAEARSRHGTSDSWAAKLRRNMLEGGVLPRSDYFLIATPERIYGWGRESLVSSEMLPQFSIDAQRALAPYFAKFRLNPAHNISPEAFELLILAWLNDIAKAEKDRPPFDDSLKSLFDSGFLSSLQRAEIQMNVAQ